ncbi:hypothetical protein GCM10010922_20770 [Microbacterium sorbitolivorans]|nr:hypothetical protein GCM10010922_20770 [Microbacterium sorbitolivorans]
MTGSVPVAATRTRYPARMATVRTRNINWREIEEAAAEQLVHAVREVREESPDENIHGAVFHAFYGDGESIRWPMVAVGTEETLAEMVDDGDDDASLRWSGPDFEYNVDPTGELDELASRVEKAAAASGDFDKWVRVYERFQKCFPKAAKLARKQLVADKAVGKAFIAVAMDEAEELVPPSLTKAQLRMHFPHYDAEEMERIRLAALPVEQRIAELLPAAVLSDFEGPLVEEYDDLLVACGAAAIPSLVSVVRGEQYPEGSLTAARILAEINITTPEAVDALYDLMRNEDADINARSWAAAALGRLERSDLILAIVPDLPAEVVTRGIHGPIGPFRDHGAHRSLDYGPLETALREYPHLEPEFEKIMTRGSTYCRLDRDEIPTAKAGLESPWGVIRNHASFSLKVRDVLK